MAMRSWFFEKKISN